MEQYAIHSGQSRSRDATGKKEDDAPRGLDVSMIRNVGQDSRKFVGSVYGYESSRRGVVVQKGGLQGAGSMRNVADSDSGRW